MIHRLPARKRPSSAQPGVEVNSLPAAIPHGAECQIGRKTVRTFFTQATFPTLVLVLVNPTLQPFPWKQEFAALKLSLTRVAGNKGRDASSCNFCICPRIQWVAGLVGGSWQVARLCCVCLGPASHAQVHEIPSAFLPGWQLKGCGLAE